MFKFRRFTPQLCLESIYEIPLPHLKHLGIRGLIFDLDNTITKHDCREIPLTALEWFRSLKSMGFKACLLSNNSGVRVEDAAQKLGIDFVPRARKPSRRGFYRAFEVMGTGPRETAMIGDQLFTDIWGGNRVGILTILVKPIDVCELWSTRNISRRGEKAIWRFVKRNMGDQPSDIAKIYAKNKQTGI
ncbi:MAG: YqeG family HAD IIIA-type phosphatase [Bacillota bacterium]